VVGYWIEGAARFLGHVVEAGNAVAGAVDAMAREYREQEQRNERSFKQLHAGLERPR
jgi:hypothetical protein